MTPYPTQQSSYENPSILVSEDGDAWAVPDGLTNPLEGAPGVGYNSDVDLLLAQDGKLYCFWRPTDASSADWIKYKSSTDGVTWSNTVTVIAAGWKTLASPTIIWNGTQYIMHGINAGSSPYKLWRRTSSDLNTWSNPVECTFTTKNNKDIWHIDVVYHNGIYYAFIVFCTAATGGTDSLMYYGTSTDGLTWQVDYPPLIPRGAVGTWDWQLIYRTSGIKTPTGWELWYSAADASHHYRIGRTSATNVE